ncbi:GlsB/YeaQ/YmgE family stress response membrane protein [Oceanisphaera sp. IT1-181]|uniref:GlsB/YeaQ/YmgE family stress response membrane protein n=1 Tax=Oceanisphaera sp. IT1-181 TaxID=3081199 RepID=UPI0029CA0DF4|nr:GlsB/YeaQ/YmgE family stress response membrane protein [Oceanisphaera sp. IT1-181]
MGIILNLIIGGLAGWIAGQMMKGRGFGVVGNILLGVVGGFFGAIMFRLLGLTSTGIVGSLVISTIGAALLLYIARKIKK